jgi:hypothetical protein
MSKLTSEEEAAEQIANSVAKTVDAAWEKAKECRSFEDAARVYSQTLTEGLYALQKKLNDRPSGRLLH